MQKRLYIILFLSFIFILNLVIYYSSSDYRFFLKKLKYWNDEIIHTDTKPLTDDYIIRNEVPIETTSNKENSLDYIPYKYQFIYEPTPQKVLDQMLPRLIEVQLFQALLESNASEHSVRMASMHQATEAANDLVKELVLFYNKARQAAITSEISEISAGANALSSK